MKRIEVVAAVVEDKGRVLRVPRGSKEHVYISGKWEFPGGKVEPDEDHEVALIREIEEGLKARIRVKRRRG